MRPSTEHTARTSLFNYDHSHVRKFVEAAGCFQEGNSARAVERLHDAVRDTIDYNVFNVHLDANLSASDVASQGVGFCLHKCILFVAGCRSLGVPALLCSDMVVNHVADPAMIALVGGDEFLHWYSQIYLNGRWIQAAPVFNSLLCSMYGVDVLKFDAAGGSIEQPNSSSTKMRYLGQRRVYQNPAMSELLDLVRSKHPKMVTTTGRTPTALSLVGQDERRPRSASWAQGATAGGGI